MNNPYNYGATHSPLSRMATVPLPAGLPPPTASMIHPALDNHNFNYSPTPLSQHSNSHHLQTPSHIANMTNGFNQSQQQSPSLPQQHQAQQQAIQQAQQQQHQQQQEVPQHQQAQQSQRQQASTTPLERSPRPRPSMRIRLTAAMFNSFFTAIHPSR